MAATNLNVLTLPGSTPIATGAFTQLTASGGTPIWFSKMLIANSTNTDIRLSFGASGSEVGFCVVGPGQTESLDVGLNIMPPGTRLAVEAVGAASSSGNYTVSLLP